MSQLARSPSKVTSSRLTSRMDLSTWDHVPSADGWPCPMSMLCIDSRCSLEPTRPWWQCSNDPAWRAQQEDHPLNFYEYVVVETDDLTIITKTPKAITDALEKVYKFKLKGTGPLWISYSAVITKKANHRGYHIRRPPPTPVFGLPFLWRSYLDWRVTYTFE